MSKLKFVRVVKKTEDTDDNLRKTKTSIGETKDIKGMLVETEKIKIKSNNPERLLDSIIQSRCLTKEQERINCDKQQEFSLPQDEYFDSNGLKENLTIKNSNRETRERKSVTSNKERKDETAIEQIKEIKETPQKKEDDEIDKPWISYLRNLRIPMMCQLHRKITFSISENALKATPPENK